MYLKFQQEQESALILECQITNDPFQRMEKKSADSGEFQ